MAIINEYRIKSLRRKLLEGIVSVIGISITVYFFFLLSMIIWYMGGQQLYNHLFIPQHYGETVKMLRSLVITAAVFFAVMLCWAKYNYFTYGKLNRRKHSLPVSINEIAELYHVEEEYILGVQEIKYVSLELADGEIAFKDCGKI